MRRVKVRGLGFYNTRFKRQQFAAPEHTAAQSEEHMHAHTERLVAEECSVIPACVNDSHRHTGEDVKNSRCDLLCGDASCDTTQGATLCDAESTRSPADTHTHTHLNSGAHSNNEQRKFKGVKAFLFFWSVGCILQTR